MGKGDPNIHKSEGAKRYKANKQRRASAQKNEYVCAGCSETKLRFNHVQVRCAPCQLAKEKADQAEIAAAINAVGKRKKKIIGRLAAEGRSGLTRPKNS